MSERRVAARGCTHDGPPRASTSVSPASSCDERDQRGSQGWSADADHKRPSPHAVERCASCRSTESCDDRYDVPDPLKERIFAYVATHWSTTKGLNNTVILARLQWVPPS